MNKKNQNKYKYTLQNKYTHTLYRTKMMSNRDSTNILRVHLSAREETVNNKLYQY